MLRIEFYPTAALFICFIFVNFSLAQADVTAVNQSVDAVENEFPNTPPDAQKEFSNTPPDAEREFPNTPPDAEKEFSNTPPDAEKEFSGTSLDAIGASAMFKSLLNPDISELPNSEASGNDQDA